MNNKHIWEGWAVQDFIDHLEPLFNDRLNTSNFFFTTVFDNKEEVKKWCIDNQPYYKKYIPEVVKYFIKKANL